MPCCCKCWAFSDDFGGSDSTSIAPDWNEVTGDWEYLGNHLHEEVGGGGTANAVVICTHKVPLGSKGQMTIGVVIIDPVDGDKDYIYPCCVDEDTVGPVEVEFLCTDAPASWTVTIRNGGDVATADFTADVDITDYPHVKVGAEVCADTVAKMVKAKMSRALDPYAWADVDPGDGRYSGLGHDNTTSGVLYDDYVVAEMIHGSVVCNDCFCRCLKFALTLKLLATFHDATGRASCLDGLTFDLDWNAALGWWDGEKLIPAGDHGTATTMEFILRCASGEDDNPDWPGENITLDFSNNVCCATNTNGCDVYQAVAVSSSCTATEMTLTFGPFYLSCEELNCNLCYNVHTPGLPPEECPTPGTPCCDPDDPNYTGEYYIVVTDSV